MNLWGIDLGGTKIEGAILDPTQPGKAAHRIRVPTGSELGYDHILGEIQTLIGRLESASGLRRPRHVGICTPGTTEPSTGVLKNSNTLCLNGRRLREDIAHRLGITVTLANDANCFALAEAVLGAARGRRVVMGLILGTGVGGGVVVDGHVLSGLHGIAGEWGHNPMRGEETPCYCGRKGCIESVLSGPSLERSYRERTGASLRLPDIVRLSGSGDPHAAATLSRLREKFAEAIGAVINVLDPDAVVVGGGVGNIELLYDEETRAAVARHVFNPEVKTEFLKPQLGDSAGVFGAAMLTLQ